MIKMNRMDAKCIKRRVQQLVDGVISVMFYGCVLFVGWIVLQVTTFASFKIPTDSMEPALIPGDNILVNKWVMGARIFDIWEAAAGEKVDVYRLPGFGEVERNDVLVFNFPYPAEWDSIGWNLKTYFVKRCVGLPGDTFEIRNAHYHVRGFSGSLGCTYMQDRLQQLLADTVHRPLGIVMSGYPYDNRVLWNIGDFGPLYIPRRGDCIPMNLGNGILYRNLISWEQDKRVELRDDSVFLGDSLIREYRFQKDYYFMVGDNVQNSQDSRYWGLLPEDYVVGKAVRIWKSENRLTGEIREERFWKKIE